MDKRKTRKGSGVNRRSAEEVVREFSTPVCKDVSRRDRHFKVNTMATEIYKGHVVSDKKAEVQTNSALITLLACPFCGGEPVGPEPAASEWWIECIHCEIVMEHFSRAEVVHRWNLRAG